jgi:hypothetical protein
MSARTDALVSQSETGKIALRSSSPLRPVVTRRVPSSTPEAAGSSQKPGSQKCVTSTAVPRTSKMLMAMMKRKNLPIGASRHDGTDQAGRGLPFFSTRWSTRHTIDRRHGSCGDTEGDHHANQNFVAVELGRWHPASTKVIRLRS